LPDLIFMKSEHLVEGSGREDRSLLAQPFEQAGVTTMNLLDRLSQFSLAGTVAYGLCTYDEEG